MTMAANEVAFKALKASVDNASKWFVESTDLFKKLQDISRDPSEGLVSVLGDLQGSIQAAADLVSRFSDEKSQQVTTVATKFVFSAEYKEAIDLCRKNIESQRVQLALHMSKTCMDLVIKVNLYLKGFVSSVFFISFFDFSSQWLIGNWIALWKSRICCTTP